MRFELFIASRYLRAKRRQAFIGIITGISIIGVTAGVASLVVALAINNGFRQDLQQRLLGSTSHISLQRVADDGIRDWPVLMDRLSKQPHVVAAAPAIFEQVLISRGPRARGAVLKGMIPRYERRVGDLLNSGKDMAENLGATVGSVVLVTSPQGELTPFGMVPKYNRFRVVGIFNSGFFDYDSSWAFARLSDAQQLFGLGDLVSVIEFKVDDIDRADQVAAAIEAAAGKGFMATNQLKQNKALFNALNMERLVMFITIGLIVFVAALNILIS